MILTALSSLRVWLGCWCWSLSGGRRCDLAETPLPSRGSSRICIRVRRILPVDDIGRCTTSQGSGGHSTALGDRRFNGRWRRLVDEVFSELVYLFNLKFCMYLLKGTAVERYKIATGHSRRMHQSNVVLGSMTLLVLLDTKFRPFYKWSTPFSQWL